MKTLTQFDAWLKTNISGHIGMIEIVATLFFTAFAHSIQAFIFHRLIKRLSTTPRVWDDVLCKALSKPLGILIWVLGISLCAELAWQFAPDSHLMGFIHPLRKFCVTALVIWFVIRFIRMLERSLLTPTAGRKIHDKTTVHAVSQLFVVSVMVIGSLIGMQLFAIPISGVLAFGGIGGAAVAFAAKDLLGNFFGGLMVYLDRPFTVGDWISSPDKNIEGVVEHVGWRLTRLRSLDKRPTYVPNGIFSTITVQNPSRMSHRRILSTIGLRYEDAGVLENIIKEIEQLLLNHSDIDTKQKAYARFCEFADSSLNITLSAFTKSIDSSNFQTTRQQIFFEIINIVKKHGADFAFPTQTVHLIK